MSMATPSFSQPRVKKWTKQEYQRCAERGFFEGQRLFLFRGDLIEMPPQGYLHHFAITELNEWLTDVFRGIGKVRIQLPLETPGESIPEPDAAVVDIAQMKRRPQPNEALLVVEVSDSSMQLDVEKAYEYAGAVVPEYWIVDCQNRCILQYRNLVDDPAAPFGKRYAAVETLVEDGQISPLALPKGVMEVRRLFP